MDGQNRTDPNDLLSIRGHRTAMAMPSPDRREKVRLLDLPMMQMGRELLARRTDVEDPRTENP